MTLAYNSKYQDNEMHVSGKNKNPARFRDVVVQNVISFDLSVELLMPYQA